MKPHAAEMSPSPTQLVANTYGHPNGDLGVVAVSAIVGVAFACMVAADVAGVSLLPMTSLPTMMPGSASPLPMWCCIYVGMLGATLVMWRSIPRKTVGLVTLALMIVVGSCLTAGILYGAYTFAVDAVVKGHHPWGAIVQFPMLFTAGAIFNAHIVVPVGVLSVAALGRFARRASITHA